MNFEEREIESNSSPQGKNKILSVIVITDNR
jgi:hypothetical protein